MDEGILVLYGVRSSSRPDGGITHSDDHNGRVIYRLAGKYTLTICEVVVHTAGMLDHPNKF